MKENNIVYTGADARNKLFAGFGEVHKVVAPTLGANGRNVVYNKWSGTPIMSNDGVSNGREVSPVDPAMRQGAALLKQVLERQNMVAGDGTSSAEILAYSIAEEGLKTLDATQMSPMKLRRQIAAATELVIAELKKSASPIASQEELESVATISVENKDLGKIIAKAISDAGDNGSVQVEEAQQEGTTISRVEGYEFGQGPVSPYMFTNPDKMETVLNNPMILLTDVPLHWTKETQAFFDKLRAQGKKEILIICDEVHPDVVKFAVVNQLKGNHKCVIVKKPMQANYLEDIATLTGGFAMTKDKGVVHVQPEYCGGADKVIIKKDSTIIIGGKAPAVDVDKHLESLKSQITEAKDDEHEKDKLQARLAKLTGGVYVIHVGGRTDAEAKYAKLKVDDAVFATKAAKEEGIVAGGGSALYHIARGLLKPESNPGEVVVFTACMSPLKTILKNSGVDVDGVSHEIDSLQVNTSGFDALELEVVPDMQKAGIIDPVKVTRSALENASGFSALFLTTESLITPVENSDNSLAPRPMV